MKKRVEEILENIPEVKPFLKVTRPATLLRPQKAAAPLPFSTSKVGGTPNLNLFEEWPRCNSCNTPLNFILQLYKDEFPQFYFPDNTTFFLLFRCPNFLCKDSLTDEYDFKMFWFYGDVSTETNKILEKPEITLEESEIELPECSFDPVDIIDYPSYEEQDPELWEKFESKYINDIDIFDGFMRKYQSKGGMKINGFPDWFEKPRYPVCTCGGRKEFFFQLSSDDDDERGEPPFLWPPHSVMTDEIGSMYFFVCKKCGKNSIETRWESHI